MKKISHFLSLACAACMLYSGNATAQTTPAPDIQWQKLLGSTGTEEFASIRPTSDNGYILTGYTNGSHNGDVSGTSHGYGDIWVVKLDASGNKTWDKLLGGNSGENPVSILQTIDGGYIILGQSGSSHSGDVTDTTTSPNLTKVWIVKLDASGNITWNTLWGTPAQQDFAAWLCRTSDGGYVFTGYTANSIGTETAAWVTKLNATGAVIWKQNLATNVIFYPQSVEQTPDGGYIVSAQNTGSGPWIGKLDAEGNKVWEKTLSPKNPSTYNILPVPDGGYILACVTSSSATGDITGITHGGLDVWIVKLDASGNKVWDKLYGGSGTEGNGKTTINITSDGGYIVSTTSTSSASGDVSGVNHGDNDIWVFKIDASGNKIWDKLMGGSGTDWLTQNNAPQMWETSDHGYILIGDTRSSKSGDITSTNHGDYDLWAVKLMPDASIATPVTMANFTGAQAGNAVVLQWATATEINNKGFNIQRSADGKNFANIGYVASQAANGNSAKTLSYTFTDASPLQGMNYYRLEQADLDGATALSPKTVSVSFAGTASGLRVYPNPAHGTVNINGLQPGSNVAIYDAAGVLVKRFTATGTSQQVDISNLAKGVYFIKVPGSNASRFIVQ